MFNKFCIGLDTLRYNCENNFSLLYKLRLKFKLCNQELTYDIDIPCDCINIPSIKSSSSS